MDDFRIQSRRRTSDGGLPARRAVTRWAWRLFRARVASTVSDPRAHHRRRRGDDPRFVGRGERSAAEGRRLWHGALFGDASRPTTRRRRRSSRRSQHLGTAQVIENETFSIPGIDQYLSIALTSRARSLRCADALAPHGHYPSNANQVAVTSGVASAFHLSVGKTWLVGGVTRDVVGIVQNPQSLLDAFALVVPGQVTESFTGDRAFSTSRLAHIRALEQGRIDQSRRRRSRRRIR